MSCTSTVSPRRSRHFTEPRASAPRVIEGCSGLASATNGLGAIGTLAHVGSRGGCETIARSTSSAASASMPRRVASSTMVMSTRGCASEKWASAAGSHS